MALPAPTVDVLPQPWTGRFDGDGGGHRRWWQAVSPMAAGEPS
ncbi:MAG TPA: formimidoylglutamase, partial [Arthrobacter sp.]|nr:formimidoylglutamase [Arthrobacter sp.]